MCIARAAVTSKRWLILNVLRLAKCFISTLGERIKGELKGNTWWPSPWHELGNPSGTYMLVWIVQLCRQRLAERDGNSHSSQGLRWEMVSGSEMCLSWGDPGLNLLHHGSHHCCRSISLEPGGRLLQQTPAQHPRALVMGFCCAGHCWRSTACWAPESSVLMLFVVEIWLKLESVLLRHKLQVYVYYRERHHYLVLQLLLATTIWYPG